MMHGQKNIKVGNATIFMKLAVSKFLYKSPAPNFVQIGWKIYKLRTLNFISGNEKNMAFALPDFQKSNGLLDKVTFG